jgi:hypothetical protein
MHIMRHYKTYNELGQKIRPFSSCESCFVPSIQCLIFSPLFMGSSKVRQETKISSCAGTRCSCCMLNSAFSRQKAFLGMVGNCPPLAHAHQSASHLSRDCLAGAGDGYGQAFFFCTQIHNWISDRVTKVQRRNDSASQLL